jgi:DNA-binding NarL/FixJ family response regulator
MNELASADLASTHASPTTLPISVVSDRALVRELVVTFLRQNGFPQTIGQEALTWSKASGGQHGLVFVDLENEHSDPRRLLQALSAEQPEVTTIAIGTPLQLAAQAADADAWLELSESTRRVTQLVTAAGRRRAGTLKMRASPKAERMLHTWRSLTRRQREVLALLGHGLDNHRLSHALGISERAVKAHVSALLDKFKADSRTELAVIAARAKLHAHTPGLSLARLI